jgi:hypothetical protein
MFDYVSFLYRGMASAIAAEDWKRYQSLLGIAAEELPFPKWLDLLARLGM